MIIYTSESSIGSFRRNIKEIVCSIGADLYASIRLAKKDIKSNYSKSYMGFIWDFLEPVMIATVFIFLHKNKFINTEDMEIGYAIFVIYGLLMWQIFNDSLFKTMDIVKNYHTLLTQIAVSAESLIIAVFLRMMFNSIFVIAAVIMISLITGTFHLTGMLMFIFFFPIVVLTGMSFGLFFLPLNTINTDINNIVKILMRALIFTSAVLFPLPKGSLIERVCHYNPLVHVFENMRYMGLGLEVHWLHFSVVIVLVLINLLISWYVFHVSLKIIIERM
jgi:ABC-type polysaccharide/polyol phosphate export permease